MGFFTKGDPADQHLRATRRELDDQTDREEEALRRGDPKATARNDELQARVIAAEQAGSRGELFRR